MTDTMPDAVQTDREVGRVETDMFCSVCGYNLHSLAVILDGRLGIPIVRCSECGKFHAAGLVTGAGRLWLSRLARILIVAWVSFLLTAVAGWGLAMFAMDIFSVEGFSHYRVLDPALGGAWGLVESSASDFGGAANYWAARAVLLLCSAAAGFGLASLATVFVAHIRREWWLLTSLLPLGVGSFVFYMYEVGGGMHFFDHSFPAWAVALQVLTQILGVVLGVMLGRTVVRALLRVLLTRKMLQHVAFLWQVDGRTVPGPRPV
jgi:hypothetical protein